MSDRAASIAGVLRTDKRLTDTTVSRGFGSGGSGSGEAATGALHGTRGATLPNGVEKRGRFGGQADGHSALGEALDTRTATADALRLPKGQRAATLAAFGPYSHGRRRRVDDTARSGQLPFEPAGDEADGNLDDRRKIADQGVAQLQFGHATAKPLSGQRGEAQSLDSPETQLRFYGSQTAEDGRSTVNLRRSRLLLLLLLLRSIFPPTLDALGRRVTSGLTEHEGSGRVLHQGS